MILLLTARRVIVEERARKPAPAAKRPSCFIERSEKTERGSTKGSGPVGGDVWVACCRWMTGFSTMGGMSAACWTGGGITGCCCWAGLASGLPPIRAERRLASIVMVKGWCGAATDGFGMRDATKREEVRSKDC